MEKVSIGPGLHSSNNLNAMNIYKKSSFKCQSMKGKSKIKSIITNSLQHDSHYCHAQKHHSYFHVL
jgi:hypothetical protein